MNRQARLIVDTLILGVVGALSAQLFTFLLNLCNSFFLGYVAGYRSPGLPSEGGTLTQIIGGNGLWLIPVVTTIGGLISGLIVFTWAPEAEGHGTDSAVRAFHQKEGFLRSRVTPIKMVASAITIGSGGAAGREGPTALISAGVGAIYATLTKKDAWYRQRLVLIGMAAGLSAIFRSPIGTALFAIEVLYGNMEFEADALLYALLGSIVAYVLNGIWVGWHPLFVVPVALSIHDPSEYLWYLALGIVSGVVGVLIPVVFYGVRDLFHKIPLPPHVKPAIGGLGVGILALWLPHILGGGYGWIQEAIDGRLALGLLLILPLAKLTAFCLTVSSGGSGGVFAPTLYVGAMIGATLAGLIHLPPAGYVVVGMAALFGGAARTPIATMVMVTEMTDGYHLLPAAALAVTVSYLVQSGLSNRLKYKSLYEAQVQDRGHSPAHRAENVQLALRMLQRRHVPVSAAVDLSILDAIRVEEIMSKEFESVKMQTPLGEIVRLIQNTQAVDFPVLDETGDFRGVVTFHDVRLVMNDPELYPLFVAADVLTGGVPHVRPEDPLSVAVGKFTETDVDSIPVIGDGDGHHILGVLSRSALMGRYYHEIRKHLAT